MNSDKKIQEDVQEELQWEPILNATELVLPLKMGS